MDFTLPRRDIVLLGLGHTNAHVLKMWRMAPIPETRLTCISNYPIATYSGMLPGVLAGQYPADRMEIDLVRLCAAANARLIVDEVSHLDREQRQVHFRSRPPLVFDVLSIGIGSVPRRGIVEGSAMLTIKPMQTFVDRLRDRLAEIASSGKSQVRICIVGAGAGGCEIAFCLAGACRRLVSGLTCAFTLVTAAAQIGSGLRPATVRRVLAALGRKQIGIRTGVRVTEVGDDCLSLADGGTIASDIVVWATDATAPPLLARLGLATDDQGFLRTRATLQSLDSDWIFVVGDSGTIDNVRLPKAGVYAVREGPVLWRNIGRQLTSTPLESYRPQRDFLRLLNTGDGRAIGEYRGLSFEGAWVWRRKDRIDGRFMDMYQDYSPMTRPGLGSPRLAESRSVAPMRCTGCGGKVAGSVLNRVLSRLEIPPSPHVELGLECPDDAAVIHAPNGKSVAVTADFFSSPVDDPYLLGRIAALHAASDLFALGARPLAALALVTIPSGSDRQQEELLFNILAGSLREFRSIGATLAGGHTIEGPELTVGFTMLGDPGTAACTKGKLRDGDRLILTKPLGTGVLLAAHQRAMCRAPWMAALTAMMLESNQRAAELVHEFDIRAVTDITGFGLAGHLLEMLAASHCRATINLAEIPLLPGVVEALQQGVASTLAPDNRSAESQISVPVELRERPVYHALFDPQTCGGLLLAVPVQNLHGLLHRLATCTTQPFRTIGVVQVDDPASTQRLVIGH